MMRSQANKLRLPVARSPDPNILTLRHTQPVWPICTPGQEQQLRELALLFGADLDVVIPETGAAALRPRNNATVISLGRQCAAAGRLYAHLTQRRHRTIDDPRELSEHGPVAVVILLAARLDAEFLASLKTATPPRSAVGLICGPTVDELMPQILLRSAALRLGGSVPATQADLFPLHHTSKVNAGLEAELGDGGNETTLASGASVLSVLTHADGVCAYLGPSAVLCPIEDLNGSGAEPKPRCIVTKSCFRCSAHSPNGPHAIRIPAPVVRARFMVLESCATVMLNDSAVAYSWSLLHSLCSRAVIGGIVANVGVVQAYANNVRAMAGKVQSGKRVGEALHGFLSSAEMRRTGRKMLLFGDPDMRAAPRTPERARQDLPVDQPGTNGTATTALTQLGLYRVILASAHGYEQYKTVANKALVSLLGYEFAAAHKASKLEVDQSAPGPMMRARLLDYLASLPLLSSAWQSLADLELAADKANCPHCGREASALVGRFHLPGVASRKVLQCLHCGVVEDVPAQFSMCIAIRKDVAVLSGRFPKGPGSGRLTLRSPDKDATISIEWPFLRSGAPAKRVELPHPSEGPVRISALLMIAGHALWAEARVPS